MTPIARSQMTRFLLADFLTPVFKSLLHQGHELVGYGTVDDAMVVAKRKVNDRTDGDRIRAVFVSDQHGLLGAGAITEVGDAALQSEEVEFVGVLENGDDESPIERDGNAGIYVLV